MFFRMITVFVVFVQVAGNSVHAEPVADLIPFVPEDANSLYIFRVKEFVNSPLGIERDWAKKHHEEHLNGGVCIPPWIDVLVRSSSVSPSAPGGEWTAIVVSPPDEITMEGIAKEESTEVQKIGSHAAVFTARRNGYFVEFNTDEKNHRVLGGMAPATRQNIARWIEEAESSPLPKVSDYLLEVSKDVKPQIILAVDFTDMLDPVQIRYRLSGLAALEKRANDRIALTLDFQSLRGVRMAVNVTQETTAEIRFDFGRKIGEEGKYVKGLLVDLLNDTGAALDELQDAKVEINGKSVSLKMPLSDESLRRVLSLISSVTPATAGGRTAPQPAASAAPNPSPPGASGVDVAKSLRYYKAVNHNVNDMEKAYKRINNYRQTAQWHDNFARRIDELPIASVDPDLLDYGQKMSSLLRGLGASLRGMGVKVDALNQQVRYDVTQTPVYRNGADRWWGGAWTAYGAYNYGRPMETKVDTNLQDVRAKQSEVVANTQPDRDRIWQMINEERSVTRRKMVARYGSDFQK